MWGPGRSIDGLLRRLKAAPAAAAPVLLAAAWVSLAAAPAFAQTQQPPPQQRQSGFSIVGAMQRFVNALPFSGVFSSRPAGPAGLNYAPGSGPPAAPAPLPGGQSLLGPPPIPPGTIPAAPSAPAAGASAPLALAPPHAPAASAPAQPVQVALVLNARYSKEAPQAINGGVAWRVFPLKPDIGGVFRPLREDRTASPTLMLPPGDYVVHASFGLASAVKTVRLRLEPVRETFDLPAGGIRIEGRVGDVPIPAGQISFDVFRGSQFEPGEKRPVAQGVMTGDVLIVPEGTYHLVSNYGDSNAVVRSDIRAQIGKLTDITVTHRAAVITLKLVGDRGGEALANTNWTVLTPGGDVVKESIGAFPKVVLAEGDYRVIARNEGRTFDRAFTVITGVDGEVELLAR